jgi:hypothetical protein
MNKQAIFTFIKKNMLSLICATIALVAVALIFYPIGGMITELQGKVDERGNLYQQLTGYLKPRKMPMSDPTAADPGNLPGLPNKATIAAGQAAVEKFKTASERMLAAVSALNATGHTQLVPDELPKENFERTAFFFAQIYKLVLSTDPSIHGVPNATANPPIVADPNLLSAGAKNIQNDILNGALPPAPAQITAAQNSLWNDDYVPLIITINGKPTNYEDLKAKWLAECVKLPQKLKGDVATTHKIYVEPNAFTVNPAITTDVRADLASIWYSQMQLWIQQDLAAGIKEANDSSTNILDAEVKRLIAMQISPAPMYVFPPASATGGGGASGVPAAADEKAPIPPIYSISPTGRYSNGMYDVVDFKLVVDVDSSKVNQFIQTLEHNRLITILSENEYALNSEIEASHGYLYGSGSSVRLVLDGEELFMRDWTKKLMPEPVQMALGLIAPKPGMSPAATPMGPGGGGFNPMGPPGMPGMPPMR